MTQHPALTVDLGLRSYPIHIASGLLSDVGNLLREADIDGRLAIVTSHKIEALYGKVLIDALEKSDYRVICMTIDDRESHKNLATAAELYDQLVAGKFDRADTLIALGGGIVGDVAGFVAATYLRGIGFVQVPTTLLAMVDASVGGKTGVNHSAGKNMIGAFYQPSMVVIDPNLNLSLPREMVESGMAEVVKSALISSEPYFADLELALEPLLTLADLPALADVIRRSCEIKAAIVADDEREQDPSSSSGRRLLNFGHTVGHTIESCYNESEGQPISHGHAVALGMIAALYLSENVAHLSPTETGRVEAVVQRLNPPKIGHLDTARLHHYLVADKKRIAGSNHFVLLKSIGTPLISNEVSETQLASSLTRLMENYG